MARKNYQIDEVLRSLSKKNDCRIMTDRTVRILTGNGRKNDLGNGSWGKIDFLTNHCGFTLIYMGSW